MHPPVAWVLEVAGQEDLYRPENRKRKRPEDVPPVPPPADQGRHEREDLERMHHEAPDILVGGQSSARTEAGQGRAGVWVGIDATARP